MGALSLSQNDIAEIEVCWNDAFRRIYGLHRWESVAPLQLYTNSLSLKLLYHYYAWNFADEIREDYKGQVPVLVKFVFEMRKYEYGLQSNFSDMYKFYGRSRSGKRSAIVEVFAREVD